LAENFAEGVPEHEFSTAELQGYLLTCKKEPEQAAEGVLDWVVQERKDRVDREVREAERKAKRDANQFQGSLGSLARLGIVSPTTATATTVGQQLGSVLEPTTPSALAMNIDLTTIGEEATRHVARRLEGFVTPTGNGPITPPET